MPDQVRCASGEYIDAHVICLKTVPVNEVLQCFNSDCQHDDSEKRGLTPRAFPGDRDQKQGGRPERGVMDKTVDPDHSQGDRLPLRS